MSSISEPVVQTAGPTSIDERRKNRRRSLLDDVTVTVLDGIHAGQSFKTLARDVGVTDVSLILPVELRIGQTMRIQPIEDDQPVGEPRVAEVMRSRLISTGRFEVVAQIRRQPAAPKVSESQRRHERRKQRLMALRVGNPHRL